MTRKDYILIAAALNDARGHAVAVPYHADAVAVAARYIASALSQDNPRFDRERFLKACGVQS